MTNEAGPNIVYNGLKMYLDAANPRSYAGTGTTWADASINGKNATLTNSPVYSGSNNGYFTFNTTNYATVGAIAGSFSEFSVMSWFNATSLTNYACVLDCNYSNNPTTGNIGPRLEIYPGLIAWTISSNTNNGIFDSYPLSVSPQASTWYFAAIVRKSNGTIDTYLNNTQVHSSATNSQGFINSIGDVIIARGFYPGNATQRSLNGIIAQVAIYSSALTSAEISQNYNATKGRYGL